MAPKSVDQKFPSLAFPYLRSLWFVVLGASSLLVPCLIELARTVWSTDQGAQGPIIIATGIWLLFRETRDVHCSARRTEVDRALPVIMAAGILYVIATILGMLWLKCLAAYIALVTVFYGYIGAAAIARLWFPLVYFLFIIPPPFSIIAPATRSLKLLISAAAVNIMSMLGFQVASSGDTIYIDQYELLVAAACSGMNSLVSLLAIGLFYIFLRHRADWRYATLLALLVVPIAILANLIRVMILMLMTHYMGDAFAQGMMHEAAGMMMFFIALCTLIALDIVLTPFRDRLATRGQT